jgi:hypothetical protein
MIEAVKAMNSTASSFNPGIPREYHEADSLGVIDQRIRDLVAGFNVPGVVSTQASCQGHRYPFLAAWQTPYVVFRTKTTIAAEIAMRVRDDSLRRAHLNYGWDIEGDFDDQGQLRFTLRCQSVRFTRSGLDHDFAVLRAWARDIFQEGLHRGAMRRE